MFLDDVITDGGAKLEALKVLNEAGLKVDGIMVVVDREDTKNPEFLNQKIRLDSLWRRSDFDNV